MEYLFLELDHILFSPLLLELVADVSLSDISLEEISSVKSYFSLQITSSLYL